MQRIPLQKSADRLSAQLDARAERRKKMQGEEARYTTILHTARHQLGITINEYCVADSVHKLSGTRSAVPGWCYASKETLGRTLGLSRRTIQYILKRLKARGIIEIQEETGYARTTELWVHTVELLKDRVFR